MEIPQVNIRPLNTDKDPEDNTGSDGGILVNMWNGKIRRKISGVWSQIYDPDPDTLTQRLTEDGFVRFTENDLIRIVE